MLTAVRFERMVAFLIENRRNMMISNWHESINNRDITKLSTLLSDDVVLHSPVIHTPIQGKRMVSMYLQAAFHTFLTDDFHYVQELVNGQTAVLEFQLTLNDIKINGIDMITWNDEQKITEFKVMIRPLKALNIINDQMTALLATMQQKAPL
jgi:ketosteroid isomerase-like protein